MTLKQLISEEEAVEVKRQHKTPCSDCPWSRASIPGWLGGHSVDQWLERAHGDSGVNCHTKKFSEQREEEGEICQCAGMAMFRANVCKLPRSPTALRLESNREKVFANDSEFRNHHERRT